MSSASVRVGIGGDDIALLGNLLRQHSRTLDGYVLPNTHMWTTNNKNVVRVLELFRGAINREADLAIVTPGIGEAPLWLSTELGKTIGQFRSFSVSASQRILFSGLQDHDMNQLNGAALALAAGTMIYAMKQTLAGREINLDPFTLAKESLDKSGQIGIFGDVLQVAGDLSKYESRSVASRLVGPTAGKIEDMVQLGGAALSFLPGGEVGDVTDADRHVIRQMGLLQNHFAFRKGIDALEQTANDFFE